MAVRCHHLQVPDAGFEFVTLRVVDHLKDGSRLGGIGGEADELVHEPVKRVRRRRQRAVGHCSEASGVAV